jgi:hypothetical protein
MDEADLNQQSDEGIFTFVLRSRWALRLTLALIAIYAPACAPAGPQQLQILSKGGPPVSVAINGAQVANVPCNGGLVFRPGENGAPQLPWDLKVVDQSTGRVVLEQRITELPRWLVVFRDSAGVSASPIAGPLVPCV